MPVPYPLPEVTEIKYSSFRKTLVIRLTDNRILVPVSKLHWRIPCSKCKTKLTDIVRLLNSDYAEVTISNVANAWIQTNDIRGFKVRHCPTCDFYALAGHKHYWASEVLEFHSDATDRAVLTWFRTLETHKLGTPAWLTKYLEVKLCRE